MKPARKTDPAWFLLPMLVALGENGLEIGHASPQPLELDRVRVLGEGLGELAACGDAADQPADHRSSPQFCGDATTVVR